MVASVYPHIFLQFDKDNSMIHSFFVTIPFSTCIPLIINYD